MHEKNKQSHQYEPLENPEVIETRDPATTLVETHFNDPALTALIESNRRAVDEGNINIDGISGLTARKDGYAYIIQHGAEDGSEDAVGAVYGIRKGMETGAIQIAYFVDSKFEGKGIMSAAVAGATEALSKKFDVMAEVDVDNERSKKLLKGLGSYAYFGSGHSGKEQFFAARKR